MILSSEQRAELWYTIKSNKRRSIVTSFGVFAGMFFFTVLVSIGEGLGNSAFGALEGVTNTGVYLIPGRTTKPYQGFKANREIETSYRDYLNIENQSKTVKAIAGFTSYGTDQAWGTTEVRANNKSRQETVMGMSASYFSNVEEMIAIHGRTLTTREIEMGQLLCMVGQDIAARFYDDISEMVGTYIDIGGVAFRVIGVVKPYTDSFSIGNIGNNGIMIPMSLAVGNNYDKGIFMIAEPYPEYSGEEVKEEVYQILARRQNLHPDDSGALVTMSMELFTNIFKMISEGINVLIWIVGMGTLVTGVISVSNILLVTVRERQREIGVRRAIGAKPADIRGQFMAESVVIIFIAGSIGVILGLVVALILGTVAESTVVGDFIDRPYPSIGILIFSVVIMLVAGVLAGLLPVYKALQIKAIDAIRDE